MSQVIGGQKKQSEVHKYRCRGPQSVYWSRHESKGLVLALTTQPQSEPQLPTPDIK